MTLSELPRESLGMISMALSAFFSAMMLVSVKLAGNEGLNTWEILLARSVFLACACLTQLLYSGTPILGQRNFMPMLHCRGALGCCSVTAFFFAVHHLPLADAMVFSFLAPMFVALLSPYFLGEPTGNTWLTILGCSIGVVLVSQPSLIFGRARLSLIGVLFGFLHASASASAKMAVRFLKEEATCVKMLYLSVYSCALSGGAMALTQDLQVWPNSYQQALLLSCGVCGFCAQVFLTLGLERVQAASGMSMSYTAIIWSELAGVFLFKEIPNGWAVAGAMIIMGSTLFCGLYSNKPEPKKGSQEFGVDLPTLSSVEEQVPLVSATKN